MPETAFTEITVTEAEKRKHKTQIKFIIERELQINILNLYGRVVNTLVCFKNEDCYERCREERDAGQSSSLVAQALLGFPFP